MILAVLLGILVGSYALLSGMARTRIGERLDRSLRGRISLALLLGFTGLGHFVRTGEMAGMLPAWVPARESLVHVTGFLEWAGALGLLVPRVSRIAGICLILFLAAVFPANIYAALHRVEMGGHGMGPMYLLVRGPFQVLLVWWAWRFAVRRDPAGGR